MKRSSILCQVAAFATLSTSFLFTDSAVVQGTEPFKPIPNVVQAGFDAYAKDGPGAAMTAWTKGAYCEGEKSVDVQAESFKQQERYFGKYQSFELLATKRIAKSSQFVYVAMNFERAALFIRFQLFKGDKDWVVQGAVFKPDAAEIMPWLTASNRD